jgi:glycosyltransferase involved in cell wall biosynthesis
VVTISRYNAAIIQGECGEVAGDKVHVVHCGVDPRVFQPRQVRPRGTRLQILCVASFEAVKGHFYLIEACRNLAARGFELDCHLVGDGPGLQAARAQVEAAGLEDRVHLHGPQPRAAVAELVAAADVFVLASVPTREGKREGIPVVLMEAMASELPVVASRLSGIPELVEDGRTGILVEPRDVAGIEAALERLAQDPELSAAMGRAGREKVLAEFDLASNTARLAALFRSGGAPPTDATRAAGT